MKPLQNRIVSLLTIHRKEKAVNPFFGAERRLAPAESYVRIANAPIYARREVLHPNAIMIFASAVIAMSKSYQFCIYYILHEVNF